VLDSGLRISPDSGVVRTAARYPTLVYHCRGSEKRIAKLEARGVTVVRVRAEKRGRNDGSERVDLRAVLADLASREVMHLFVEGGGVVASSFLRRGLVDKLLLFVAPRVMGDLNGLGAFSEIDVSAIKKSHGFRIEDIARVDPDLMITLYP
jgi:diaminohydroxyphosphoribosylaminopyrimidine deaminase/5-amino-6-(5-phosphoribosylamino)uracil reductase